MERAHGLWPDMTLDVPKERVVRPAGVLWRALGAILVGALLGALAGTQYDQVFGFSQPLSAIVQAVVFAAAWTRAGS